MNSKEYSHCIPKEDGAMFNAVVSAHDWRVRFGHNFTEARASRPGLDKEQREALCKKVETMPVEILVNVMEQCDTIEGIRDLVDASPRFLDFWRHVDCFFAHRQLIEDFKALCLEVTMRSNSAVIMEPMIMKPGRPLCSQIVGLRDLLYSSPKLNQEGINRALSLFKGMTSIMRAFHFDVKFILVTHDKQSQKSESAGSATAEAGEEAYPENEVFIAMKPIYFNWGIFTDL